MPNTNPSPGDSIAASLLAAFKEANQKIVATTQGATDTQSREARRAQILEPLVATSPEMTDDPVVPFARPLTPKISDARRRRMESAAELIPHMTRDKERLDGLFWARVGVPNAASENDRLYLTECWIWNGHAVSGTPRFTFYVLDDNGDRLQASWNVNRYAWWSLFGEDFLRRIEKPPTCKPNCANVNHLMAFGTLIRTPKQVYYE